MDGSTFSTSITMGTMPITRSSRAAVSQVVQPRLEPPATTKRSTLRSPPASVAITALTVSIARTALFTIAPRGSQRASPVCMNRSQA